MILTIDFSLHGKNRFLNGKLKKVKNNAIDG